MKPKYSNDWQQGYWAKLMGVLVAVGIVVVLVFNGFQNVLSQVSEMQRQLDTKSIELDVVSGQLVEANREMIAMTSELNDVRNAAESDGTALESAQAKLTEYRQDLARAQSQLDVTTRQLQDKSSELSDAHSQIAAMKTELSEKTDLLEALRAEPNARRVACESYGAFAKLDRDKIQFDLLCQPLYPKTIELKRHKSITIKVNSLRFKEASGHDRVRFRIRFAIDHGRLEITELGKIGSRKLSDSGGRNLRDIEISTVDDEVEIKITNVGYRSAEFDLALWPRQ